MSFSLQSLLDNLKSIYHKPSLLELVRVYLSEREKDVLREEIKPSTFKMYKSKLSVLTKYLMVKQQPDIKPSAIDENWARDLIDYFLQNKKSKDYANYVIQLVVASLDYAVSNKVLKHHNLQNLKLSFKYKRKHDKLSLTEREAWKNFNFKKKIEIVCRDLSLLQSYEGMPWADLYKLVPENIGQESFVDHAGNLKVIDIFQYEKTKSRIKGEPTLVIVEVFAETKEILLKYDYKLPLITYRQYRYQLKKMGEKVGLPIKITSHVFRRTFAQLMTNKKYSPAALGLMMGHKDYKTTLIYAQPGLQRLLQETSDLLS